MKVLWCAAACALTVAAQAQEPPRRLTADTAAALACERSPLARGAAARRDIARADAADARAQTRPMVSANAFVWRAGMDMLVAGPSAGTPPMLQGLGRNGVAAQSVMAMLPLVTSGRLPARIRAADAGTGAAEDDLETRLLDIALAARLAYREVQGRRALWEVARARRDETRERLRRDRERLGQEQIPAFYVSRDEAEAAAAEQEVVDAERDVARADAALRTVLGLPLDAALELSEPLAAPDAETASLATLQERAAEARPELKAAQNRVRVGRETGVAARGAFGPQVNAFAMGSAARTRSDGMQGVAVGISASVALADGGARRAAVDGAAARVRVAEAERDQIALEIAQEVHDAWREAQAARAGIAAAEAARTAAGAEYDAAKARYDAGRSVLSELLDSFASRTRAETARVTALLRSQAAQDRLRRAVGER